MRVLDHYSFGLIWKIVNWILVMLKKKPGFRQNSMELRNAVETNNTGDKEVGNHNNLNKLIDLILFYEIDAKF